MFGPDVCGSTKKVHLILNYKGKNVDWTKTNNVAALSDTNAHVYTAIIHPDLTYELLIDGEKKESGNVLEDWPLLAPKTIDDPSAKKPADWVDEKEIVDPNDKKPADWDVPKTIPDPAAKKPDDWDEEEDGKWEPPQITNPEYRGEYSSKMIPNPAYKGEWKPNQIPNPDFKEDSSIGKYTLAFAGIDIWQVKSGTIFNNILVTDSVEEAKKARDEVLAQNQKDKESAEAQKKEEDAKKEAEAAKAQEAAKDFEKSKDSEDELAKLAKEKAEQLKKEAGDDSEKKDEL
jgi:calreticulin